MAASRAGGLISTRPSAATSSPRTASRLIEMQSRDWLEDWAERHKGKGSSLEARQAKG
ncbi:hypothetical protein NKI54_17520 [Mesorhizobium sp. M0663]|uniref:hypothetical protein n=1 Tax=Mesorhizobium sp. M0663 TaxID=2956981 RepID=UPI0033351DE4